MITGGSCPHPLYRITGVSPRRRAATVDFAEALLGVQRTPYPSPVSCVRNVETLLGSTPPEVAR